MDSITQTARKLDLSQLLIAHTGLAVLGGLSSAPAYNLPIFLFGLIITSDSAFKPKLFKQLAALIAFTFILDLMWIIFADTSFVGFLLILLGVILKPFTVATTIQSLKSEGLDSNGISFHNDEMYEHLDEGDATPIEIDQNFMRS
ncbi:hypothetical protein BB559_006385 [Furculomyces boomerangus]|uniref:Uncharacterized protein n=2 Tax=Harpellales TaxID=61421 RepID=A0A2T9Y3A3_9FUNG|nr:hypothetical protein BB559_007014 [Furculomyces boomerangus]PVU86820.1 hypothetical protein BB559_006385 [Furculomyces boomerangus]PVZ98429.1 hypothetical protein BB558_005565 [Smittium angustum]